MKRFLVGLLILAGCSAEPVATSDGYRDQSVAITSSTRFDAAQFAGDWTVIEQFTELAPRPVKLSFTPRGAGFAFSVDFLDSNEAPPSGIPPFLAYEIAGPGQMQPQGQGHVMWVLWVDEDHRSAVLGNPDGSMGRIINRTPNMRADRLRAAREVLAFNGYDVSNLVRVVP